MKKTKEQVAAEIKALLEENDYTFAPKKDFEEYGDMDDYTLNILVIDKADRWTFRPKGSLVWRE